ncbi:hypothetical protein BURK2_00147 [Burkholderiales bacterium]|nr:hypothetical protein BURK2_00147 [Burkholderiales bacterium]
MSEGGAGAEAPVNTSGAPELRLRVLGGFLREVRGAPRPLNYEKGRALLAYLALESSRMHARKALAQLFWPDLPSDAARTNLRQVAVLQFKFDCPGSDDPDEAYALLAAAQARCVEVVRAQDGYLAQLRGAARHNLRSDAR